MTDNHTSKDLIRTELMQRITAMRQTAMDVFQTLPNTRDRAVAITNFDTALLWTREAAERYVSSMPDTLGEAQKVD